MDTSLKSTEGRRSSARKRNNQKNKGLLLSGESLPLSKEGLLFIREDHLLPKEGLLSLKESLALTTEGHHSVKEGFLSPIKGLPAGKASIPFPGFGLPNAIVPDTEGAAGDFVDRPPLPRRKGNHNEPWAKRK